MAYEAQPTLDSVPLLKSKSKRIFEPKKLTIFYALRGILLSSVTLLHVFFSKPKHSSEEFLNRNCYNTMQQLSLRTISPL